MGPPESAWLPRGEYNLPQRLESQQEPTNLGTSDIHARTSETTSVHRIRVRTHPEDYSRDELASLYRAHIDALPVPCTCRRTALQQERIKDTTYVRPRPRIGVDAQGLAFEDWTSHPPSRGFERLPRKEQLLRMRLSSSMYHDITNDAHVYPVRIWPRRPRSSSTGFILQFRHVPPVASDYMETWHVERGRCLTCIARAMRTFPLWIIKLDHFHGAIEDGNPVFTNRRQDELVEWDEGRKRWRHLVFDHYQWVPVEELEERPSDCTADARTINGLHDTPVPDSYTVAYWRIIDT
ncbi:hypothetical protein PUNSTDRAFT_55464 [Punctularia strigosozonata HHB-11173 SS5]|uniref:Uncharacterized protein n=1 Tax=Punctularia strigosozonata (strain HHB-11173) TaxID=741275 RepID=R7S529_PUNST|nr:uncharacterized protein PUNSTDRAFT_55464 [Punctularia strigosozonata HHB-11173 SS5]EIN04411.1 hypothetical protein PUNSTDRAFT_55464 [Punctularia strigosozonata HHB-11173 SS5]